MSHAQTVFEIWGWAIVAVLLVFGIFGFVMAWLDK